MKHIIHNNSIIIMVSKAIVFAAVLTLCFSCGKSTEKYASKEHGKQFGAWELYYEADDYGTYWPSVVLSESNEGELVQVESVYSWWGNKLVRRDTTITTARFEAVIYNVKSKNDAKHYDSIKLRVLNTDGEYNRRQAYHFMFNEGQPDSLSFTAGYDNGYIKPNRKDGEKIIALFCGKEPVSVKVTCEPYHKTLDYSFSINGSTKLSDGLAINHQRRLLAEKESKRIEQDLEKEYEKELAELFK